MSRKHYEKAAEIVRIYRQPGGGDNWRAVRNAFEALFAGDNPRFDVERFRQACGDVDDDLRTQAKDPFLGADGRLHRTA